MAQQFGAPKGCRWFHKSDGKDGYLTLRIDPGMDEPDSSWTFGQSPKSDEMRRKMSEALTGRVMTPTWKERMSLASKGKPKSEAHKAAMSASQKARAEAKKASK